MFQKNFIRPGAFALIPALVNAHGHLEFSDLSAPLPPAAPFSAWIRSVLTHRRNRAKSPAELVAAGWREVAEAGTAAIGEIVTSDLPPAAYRGGVQFGTLFREVIGPRESMWDELIACVTAFVRQPWPSHLRPGISPHAPYTVPERLLERLIAVACQENVPLAVHLAETPAERELLQTGRGELVDLMKAAGLWQPELHVPGRTPLHWLQQLALAPRALVIHGNHLNAAELDFLAATPSLTLVYCPRTHRYFGHSTHPFLRVLAAGGRVALGTDGRSSNPDLNLWQECVFLRQHCPNISSSTILTMATLSGATALGWEGYCGKLAANYPADFLVVQLPSLYDHKPPELFHPRPDNCCNRSAGRAAMVKLTPSA